MLYKFKTPYEFEGKKYEELEADLTQLKGRDLADAKRAYTKAGNFAVLPVTDADYCVEIISTTCPPVITSLSRLRSPIF